MGRFAKKVRKFHKTKCLLTKEKKGITYENTLTQLDIFIHFHNLFLPTSQKLLNIFKMYWTLTFDALIWQKNVRKKRPIVFPYKIWRRKTVFTWEFQESKLLFSFLNESVQMGQPPFLMVEMEVPSNNKVPPNNKIPPKIEKK